MLLDNKSHGRVGETLADSIGPGCRLSIATSAFPIRGDDVLRDALGHVDSARLLLSCGDDDLLSDSDLFRLSDLAGSDVDRRFRNQLNMAVIAGDCARWLRETAAIRAAAAPVPQNLFHIASESGPGVAIHGSSTLTSSGLGVTPSPAFEMNTCYSTPDETNSLLDWFGSMWEDARFARDVRPQVLAQLEEMYSPKPAELIYFLTLHNVFRDSLGELEEDRMINPAPASRTRWSGASSTGSSVTECSGPSTRSRSTKAASLRTAWGSERPSRRSPSSGAPSSAMIACSSLRPRSYGRTGRSTRSTTGATSSPLIASTTTCSTTRISAAPAAIPARSISRP